jgi:hypothetical protein
MNVFVENRYTTPVWLAVMYYDPFSCGDHGDWTSAGWWRTSPGESVFPFWTYNRYAAFYAEADDGAVWAGDRPAGVGFNAFQWCALRTANYVVGMRLLDLGHFAWVPAAPYTLTLTA